MTRSPSRDDTATMTCPICQHPFTPAGRQRYCTDACRKTAFRRRHHDPPGPITVPAARPRRDHTIYECPDCGSASSASNAAPTAAPSPAASASAAHARTATSPSPSPTFSQEVVTMPGSS